MSIINDALKKAGQPIISDTSHSQTSTHTHKAGSATVKPVARIERRKNTPNWGPLFIVGILFLITGPIVAPVFFNNPSSKILSAPSDMDQSTQLSSSLKGQYAVEEMPIPRDLVGTPKLSKSMPSGPKFRLSGVVYSQAESYCLINGKVVKLGDQIGTATVEKISPNEVVLNNNGETIVLPVEV